MTKLTDKVLNVVNEEKTKRGMADTHAPLIPLFKKVNNELNILVLLTKCDDNIWDINENIKADYYALLDPKTLKLLEFNKTSEKDYIEGQSLKALTDNTREIVEYEMKKKKEYKDFLVNDILNNSISLQDDLSKLLDNKIKVDGETVELNTYIKANMEKDVNELIDEVVDEVASFAVRCKYSTITYYYEEIFNRVVDDYIENNSIDDKMIEAVKNILSNYYVGMIF